MNDQTRAAAGGPGPGRHPRRRPLGQRPAGARLDGEGRRRRRPPGRVPRDDPDRLSGRGPRAARVLRARQRAGPRRPRDPARRRRPGRGRGRRRLPGAHRGQRPGAGGQAPDGRRPARRREPPPRRPAQRRRPAVRRHRRRPLLQAAPAQLRRLRRGPLLRARHRAADRAAARGRHRADRLRGPLGRARPVRCRRHGRRRPGLLPQRLPLRAREGRPAAAAGEPPRPESKAPILYCNQVGGQDELVFDGDSLVVDAPTASCSRGRPSSSSTCSPSTCRSRRPRRAGPRAGSGRSPSPGTCCPTSRCRRSSRAPRRSSSR